MRSTHRSDHLGLSVGREDRLEPHLRNALLHPALADRRARPFAAEERPGAFRVPRTALVIADAAGAGGKDRVAHNVERLERHEDDELAVHAKTAPIASSVDASRSIPEAFAFSVIWFG